MGVNQQAAKGRNEPAVPAGNDVDKTVLPSQRHAAWARGLPGRNGGLGWAARGWRYPPLPAAATAFRMTEPLIDVTLLKCTSAVLVVGPRETATAPDWDQAFSQFAADELADELRQRGFQRPLAPFNVTCNPVARVQVVALADRGQLDAAVANFAATVVLYVALNSVKRPRTAKNDL